MTLPASKKSQSDMLDPVKRAGWKEDPSTMSELRRYDPTMRVRTYRSLRDAADLIRADHEQIVSG